ncbi:MAG: DUF2147 domain-containing protein [Spirochaetaceae bacterium]|nr:DUF2147 domain-containing protein [Spirochaetaceae bacterium]
MKAKTFVSLLILMAIAVTGAFAQESIVGLWKQVDDKTGKPTSLVYIYEFQGKLFGRMIASYADDGTIGDTILTQKDKADKLAGDPPFCGLDYVYNLEMKGKEYRGGITDPRDAKEYDCRVWKEGNKLIVRGQLKGLGFLGKNQTWVVASPADLPAGFQMPDPKTFVPVIPKKK